MGGVPGEVPLGSGGSKSAAGDEVLIPVVAWVPCGLDWRKPSAFSVWVPVHECEVKVFG